MEEKKANDNDTDEEEPEEVVSSKLVEALLTVPASKKRGSDSVARRLAASKREKIEESQTQKAEVTPPVVGPRRKPVTKGVFIADLTKQSGDLLSQPGSESAKSFRARIFSDKPREQGSLDPVDKQSIPSSLKKKRRRKT